MRRLTYITMMLGIAIMMGCGGKSTNTDANTNDSTAVTESEETKKAEEKAHGVDLGLSVNWAECNVGASAPQEFGLLTSYGNVMGRRIDAEPIRADISGTNHDIARVKLGKPWRMPTYNELMELINNYLSSG